MTANIDPGTIGWVFVYYKDIFDKYPEDALFFVEEDIGNTWIFKPNVGEDYDDPAYGAPKKGTAGILQDFSTTPEIHTEAQFEGVAKYSEYLAFRRQIQRAKIEPSRKVKKNMNQWTRRRARLIKHKLPTVAEVNAANEAERRQRRSRKRRNTRRAHRKR